MMEHAVNAPPAERATPSNARLPPALKTFLTLSFVLTLGCILVELLCTKVFHLPYPYNRPLMEPGMPFCDLYLYKPRYAFYHSPLFFSFKGPAYMYPAPPSVLYRLFYYFHHSTRVFLVTLFVTAAIAAVLFARKLIAMRLSPFKVAGFLLLTFACSFAFFFEFEQANMEFIVWALVAGGVWAFLRRRGYSAAVCFGIAGAMKFYPLVFLGLFITRRQYRETVTAVAVYALTTLTSLWLLCPDIKASWHGTQKGLATFREFYMLQYNQVGFDHSLFGLIKRILRFVKIVTHSSAPPGREALAHLLTVYLPIVALCGVVLYFTTIRKLPIVNQVMCLTIASILLPPVSFEYTLLHLYIPWALLVLLAVDCHQRVLPGLAAAFICFAIILSPESEFIVLQHSVGGQIKAVTLMVLMALGLKYRFQSSYDVEKAGAAT